MKTRRHTTNSYAGPTRALSSGSPRPPSNGLCRFSPLRPQFKSFFDLFGSPHSPYRISTHLISSSSPDSRSSPLSFLPIMLYAPPALVPNDLFGLCPLPSLFFVPSCLFFFFFFFPPVFGPVDLAPAPFVFSTGPVLKFEAALSPTSACVNRCLKDHETGA